MRTHTPVKPRGEGGGEPPPYSLLAIRSSGLFDIVNEECGHAHPSAGTIRRASMKSAPDEVGHTRATRSVCSLSPLGERVGVRGLPSPQTITPHPTPLPKGEGADRGSVDECASHTRRSPQAAR